MTSIEHRHLRSALEYAVLIATEGQKRRPALAFPKELKPFLGKPRVAANSLGRIRRAVEADPTFRSALSAGVQDDLVDEVGQLWLAGRPGWEDDAARIVAERDEEAETSDLRRELKRAEKRRAAAERAMARAQVDVLQRDATIAEQAIQLDEQRADLTKATEALEEVRAELIDTRNEVRHARDREAAAVERAASIAEQPGEESTGGEQQSDEALIRAERQLAEVATASREFIERIESLVAPRPSESDTDARRGEASRRRPVRLPGGLISTSAAAAQHLINGGAPIFVDGYNVAKLAWPQHSLVEQRETLISRCENLARRHGADVTIVFDGDSIPGAHAPKRRSIRVVYSPTGTTADDVIRAEVEHLPDDTAVVVVTNDREIVDDVKAVGANVVPSNAFIALL